jgi:hypothetical protein
VAGTGGSPVQQIVGRSGTLFFSFQDLDSTKPAGSVKIRVETISYYLGKYSADIMAKKKAASPPGCPLGIAASTSTIAPVSPGYHPCRVASAEKAARL